ncbi:MAG: polysaccharide pyruvyl transferase family protein [Candidatus Cyclonatronum sp.]|uniref:polysaccharide pyruvyl transferase family protein n=1 Tax=Cyclonatronum sp. TaxID=3024185 RepID=UPI0025BD8915|nr:polysaccharide pyruvyl transferase family protein [Cyclonatronum sp.]MCH8486172.1 polysaccharide pyruvyl transferase family protein [Cyclonatronum sp.]
MSKPSFLIVGANFTNKGAEAMLKTVQHQILQRYDNAVIYAICHENEAELASTQGIVPLYVDRSSLSVFLGKVAGKLRKIFRLKSKPYADYTPVEKLSQIKNLKTAIDASGFAYGDKGGYIQPLETMKVMDYCEMVDAPYIFMPQAWGSFKDHQVAENCRKMLTRTDTFFARDEVSRTYLANLLLKPAKEVYLLPDIAFHFPIPTLDGNEILKSCGYENPLDRPVLGISPNMRIYEKYPERGRENEYLKLLLDVIESLKNSYHIVLIPNEIRPEGSADRDDAYLCKTLYDAISGQENITLISGYRSAEEIKAVIRETDLLIASRFHSLIFALSLGIACMAISWSHKYRELFALFELEHFVVEHKDMNAQYVLQLFGELESSKNEIEAKINKTLPELKAKNAGVFDFL